MAILKETQDGCGDSVVSKGSFFACRFQFQAREWLGGQVYVGGFDHQNQTFLGKNSHFACAAETMRRDSGTKQHSGKQPA